MFCTLSTKVRQSAAECEIRWCSMEKCARVWNSVTKYRISAKKCERPSTMVIDW